MKAAPTSGQEAGFRYRRFPAALGAEIVGLDLAQALDDATFAAVRRCYLDSEGVLVLRDQHITPEQHIVFSRRFGPLAIHVLRQFMLPGHPEILLVSNIMENGKPIGLGDAGRYWHSDLSYVAEPSLGSLLHAQELPEEGGDTSFANLYAAYEALPPDVKRRLEGKRATHSYRKSYDVLEGSTFRPKLSEAQKAAVQAVVHPVVRTHPETGRKALFVNEGFTERILDIPEAESRELLQFLFAHSTEARFTYRHHWQDHDLVFWDNRCVVHYAHGCPPELRRHMHRTTVQGDAPF
ncbi:MAG TPA: TauD/TfdA family dioxygenase [Stellaceae bacterium]|nr:TauD/TfdA family dioxygenase [Stellaceae bacterium]